MRVRCPACRTVHDEPAPRFDCAGCGRRLAWQPPPLWLGEQLTLFVPEGTTEALTLPLTVDSAKPKNTFEPVSAAEEPRTVAVVAKSVALITAFLDYPLTDTVPALLADESPEEALELVAATAWLASSLVKLVDDAADGAGTAWLRAVGLGLQES